MITCKGHSWLLHKFSSSALKEMYGNIMENMYTDARVERVKILCGNGDRAKFSHKPRVEEIQPEHF